MDIARLKVINENVNATAVMVSTAVMVAMALMTTLDVTLRYFFGKPLMVAMEMTTLMEPWVVFLAMSYAMAAGAHVRVTIVLLRMSPKARAWCDMGAFLICFVICGAVTLSSLEEFIRSYSIGEFMLAAYRLPLWAGKAAEPIGMFLLTLQAGCNMVYTWHRMKEDSKAPAFAQEGN